MIGQVEPSISGPQVHAGIGLREFVCIVAAIMAIGGLGLDIMLPALSAIGRDLGVAHDNQRQWIITAYLLGFGPAQIVYGPISDRFGRRPLMLGGLVGYMLCCLGIVVAPTFAIVVALRILQGVAIAATRVVSMSMLRDCYGGRQMARVMSLAILIFLAVPILAPSIGQFLMLLFPWRGLFAALATAASLLFAWIALRLPETLHPEFRRPVSTSVVLAGMRTALSNRQASGYMIVQALMQGALYGFVNSVEQIFSDVFHASHLMPTIFAAIALMTGLSSLLNARIVERLGTRRVSHTAVIGFTLIETAHLAVAVGGHETMASFAAFQALSMFFFGLSMGNFGAIAMEPLAALAGTAASVQGFVVMAGGSVIGMAIGQTFNGSTIPMTAGFTVAGVLSITLILWTERGRLFRPHMGA